MEKSKNHRKKLGQFCCIYIYMQQNIQMVKRFMIIDNKTTNKLAHEMLNSHMQFTALVLVEKFKFQRKRGLNAGN